MGRLDPMTEAPFTTRLAPSPTGALHLGNARTLALTWWWARAASGTVVLRIEDLDSPRKKQGAIEQLRADLLWLGLDHDRETPLQTLRAGRHQAAIAALLARGAAYPCVCSRKDVEESQSAPHEQPGDLRYPGTCAAAGLPVAEALARAGRPVAIRFRVPAGRVAFRDLVAGPQDVDLAADSGDFVIARAASPDEVLPGYQLAVVLDDADDGVTRVIRGRDLLLSAARQIVLQRALSLPPVEYAHVPLVVGPDGKRLAKRHGDTRLLALRGAGVAADAIWSWIAASVGRPFRTVERLVDDGFDPAWIPPEPVLAPSGW
jgi:glutamyl-tRNA synthetase